MRANANRLNPPLLLAATVLATTVLAAPMTARAAAPDSVPPPASSAEVLADPPVPKLFSRGDLLFLGGTIATVALAMTHDQWLTDRMVAVERNATQQRVAEIFQPLGRTQYLVAGAVALHVGGRLLDRPRLARRATRVGIAVTLAAGTSLALKRIVGRDRPEDSPRQSEAYQPFNGGDSFPSGHATTAFAAAAALDRETDSRWVPFLAYPAATLVAWSRVHDHKHWTSDVLAGAALGGWMAWKTESFLEHRALGVPPGPGESRRAKKNALWLVPRDGGLALAWSHAFER